MRFIRGDSLQHAIDRLHRSESAKDHRSRALELRSLLLRMVEAGLLGKKSGKGFYSY